MVREAAPQLVKMARSAARQAAEQQVKLLRWELGQLVKQALE
jgi:hypothetical protein